MLISNNNSAVKNLHTWLMTNAINYLKKVVKENGDKIILVDESQLDSEDASSFLKIVYKLPTSRYLTKQGNYDEYAFLEISIRNNGNLDFLMMDIGGDGPNEIFTIDNINTEDLLNLTFFIEEKYSTDNMTQVDLTEKVAELVHDVWGEWMKYMFSKCHDETSTDELAAKDLFNRTGNLIIPKELVDRWKRQMNTPYQELPEAEKTSDRVFAERYLNKITE